MVAAPPRPPVYVRKPAFWQKRVFWVGVAVVVVLAVLTGVMLSVNANQEKDLKAKTLAAVNAFKAEVEGKLPPPRIPRPPRPRASRSIRRSRRTWTSSRRES